MARWFCDFCQMMLIYPWIFPFHFTKNFKSFAIKKAPISLSYQFQEPFLEALHMASSSSKPMSAKISPYNLPLTRACNRQEGEAFVENHRDILNNCKVWWEPGHDIYVELSAPSNPQRPCTRIYPWFLDLGLRFSPSNFMKSILLCYNIAICNLSPTATSKNLGCCIILWWSACLISSPTL